MLEWEVRLYSNQSNDFWGVVIPIFRGKGTPSPPSLTEGVILNAHCLATDTLLRHFNSMKTTNPRRHFTARTQSVAFPALDSSPGVSERAWKVIAELAPPPLTRLSAPVQKLCSAPVRHVVLQPAISNEISRWVYVEFPGRGSCCRRCIAGGAAARVISGRCR